MAQPAQDQDRFAPLLQACQGWAGVTVRRMFGTDGLFANAKVFALPWRGALVLRLPEDTAAEALARPGVHLFQPMKGRRPSPGWVEIPPETTIPDAELSAWAREAYQAVQGVGGPARPVRRSKAR